MSDKQKRKRITPYQKIMRAMNRGTGVRLTAKDVLELSLDDAIEARGLMDEEGADER